MESKIKDLRQQIFKFKNNSDFNKSDFFVSQSNFFAYNLLKSWPKWEKKFINVFGEKKSGKSHLTNIFLEDKGGIKILYGNIVLVTGLLEASFYKSLKFVNDCSEGWVGDIRFCYFSKL